VFNPYFLSIFTTPKVYDYIYDTFKNGK